MKSFVLSISLALLVLKVDADLLLGSEKCTWGPSYWCSGLVESAKCKATCHCIDKVWTKTNYPPDNDDVCTICKNMVAQARDQLESNETQTELKEVFEGSCRLIPIKLVAAECIKLADDFVPELLETLASEMNPETVCSIAGLCNSKKVDKLLKHFYSQHQMTNCDKCQSEARKLSYKIRSMDKNKLLDKILDLCGYLGFAHIDACKITILDQFDSIYNTLVNLNNGLCDLVGMCGENVSSMPAVFVTDNIECEFCEKVIKHWVDTWTANTTEEEFKQVLDALCHKIKDNEKQARCLHIVDDYYIPWFNFLLHEINPKQICAFVGLCDQPLQTSSRTPQQVKPVNDGHILIGGYFAPQTALEVNRPGCVACEYVLRNIHQIIQPSRSRAKVEKAMEEVCNLMPESVKDQCQNVVDTYGKAIVELLIKDFDPDHVCQLLRLCQDNDVVSFGGPQLSAAIQDIKGKEDQCAMCQYGLQYLFEMLENKDDRNEIRNVLQTLCSLLPQSVEHTCEDFVYKYTEQVIDLIVKGFTPDEICSAMSLCPGKKKSDASSETCILCEYVIQTLDDIMKNQSEREAVKHALDMVCSYLPKSISEECVNLVNVYSDMIIDLITQGTSPDQICISIHLCEAKGLPALEMDFLVDDEKPYCMLCEYAITEVDKLIEDKQNEEEIRKALDKICHILSAPIQKECLTMVDKYTAEIIEMFVKEYTPKQVCQELELCKQLHDPATNEISSQINSLEADPTCVLCEFAMSILEKKVLTNSTMDMVERGIQMLCSYMPSTIEDSCSSFIDKYGDKIIRLIIEIEMNPKEVCTALSLCSTAELWDARPLGGTYCSFGPALWCQSYVHAQTCGLLDYCQNFIWN